MKPNCLKIFILIIFCYSANAYSFGLSKVGKDLIKIVKKTEKLNQEKALEQNVLIPPCVNEESFNHSLALLDEEIKETVLGPCESTELMDVQINNLGNSFKAKKTHIQEQNFSKNDSFLSLVKSKQYQRAFYFYQLNHEKIDLSKELDSQGNSALFYLAQDCEALPQELFGEVTGMHLYQLLSTGEDFEVSTYRGQLKQLKFLDIELSEEELQEKEKNCSRNKGGEDKNFFLQNERLVYQKNKKGQTLYDLETKKCAPNLIYKYLKAIWDVKKASIPQGKNLDYVTKNFGKDYPETLIDIYPNLTKSEKERLLKMIKEDKVSLISKNSKNLIDLEKDEKNKQQLLGVLKAELVEKIKSDKLDEDDFFRMINLYPSVVRGDNDNLSLLSAVSSQSPNKQEAVKQLLLKEAKREAELGKKPESLISLIKYGNIYKETDKEQIRDIIKENKMEKNFPDFFKEANYKQDNLNKFSNLINSNSKKMTNEEFERVIEQVCNISLTFNTSVDCQKIKDRYIEFREK